jgi:hypothetical protein
MQAKSPMQNFILNVMGRSWQGCDKIMVKSLQNLDKTNGKIMARIDLDKVMARS